jgi:hypothetical protein
VGPVWWVLLENMPIFLNGKDYFSTTLVWGRFVEPQV